MIPFRRSVRVHVIAIYQFWQGVVNDAWFLACSEVMRTYGWIISVKLGSRRLKVLATRLTTS